MKLMNQEDEVTGQWTRVQQRTKIKKDREQRKSEVVKTQRIWKPEYPKYLGSGSRIDQVAWTAGPESQGE